MATFTKPHYSATELLLNRGPMFGKNAAGTIHAPKWTEAEKDIIGGVEAISLSLSEPFPLSVCAASIRNPSWAHPSIGHWWKGGPIDLWVTQIGINLPTIVTARPREPFGLTAPRKAQHKLRRTDRRRWRNTTQERCSAGTKRKNSSNFEVYHINARTYIASAEVDASNYGKK